MLLETRLGKEAAQAPAKLLNQAPRIGQNYIDSKYVIT